MLATIQKITKITGKERAEMDKENIRITAVNLLNNELPDIKVFLEDKGSLWWGYCHYHYLTDTKKRHRKPMPFQRKQYYCFMKDCHLRGFYVFGAADRGRTDTDFTPLDFESSASANSTTAASAT